jgi:Ni,Fe-hydrogenase III small subunit
MIKDIQILIKHGIQYVPDIRTAAVSPWFRGRPILRKGLDLAQKIELEVLCPTSAIQAEPFSLDMGRCVFCRECEFASGGAIQFTPDYRISANRRQDLVVQEGEEQERRLDESSVRPEIRRLFAGALKLRQVSAAGDNSCEMELNAAGNVNFDMGRYGIQFVASPRHADGLVLTGPVSENMARALQITWDAIPEPRILVVAGTDAISGGLFVGSEAVSRQFFDFAQVDLWVPGNPCHPLTLVNGLLDLTRGTNYRGR